MASSSMKLFVNKMKKRNLVNGSGNINLVTQFNNRQSDLGKSLKVDRDQLMESAS